jgi:hypothetical protein
MRFALELSVIASDIESARELQRAHPSVKVADKRGHANPNPNPYPNPNPCPSVKVANKHGSC